MAQFKILNRQHPEYDPLRIHKSCLLYKGGYDIMREADLFLPKLASESIPGYQERLKSTSYVPFLSQFVDYYTSFLFSEETQVKEAIDKDDEETIGKGVEEEGFWKLFSTNCDLNTNSLHCFIEEAFAEALIHGSAFIGIDFPNIDIQVSNRLEEELAGKDRAYLYNIDAASVIDWKYRPDYECKYEWIKLRNEIDVQDGPLGEPMHKIQFIIWTLNEQGNAVVEVYETRPLKAGEIPNGLEDLQPILSKTTSFTEIPVFELSIDEGLALGKKIGPLCEEHYQRRSLKNFSENKALVAIPVAYLGPNIPAVGGAINENQEDPGRADALLQQFSAKGITVLGNEDKFDIVETKGTAHETMEKSLEKLEHLMLQTVHQMANAARAMAGKAARSAESQVESRFQTEIILSSYAHIVRDFIKEIYNCIATARQEEVVWVVSGLCTSAPPDPADVIQKALLLPQLNIPSVSFKKKITTNVAFALLEGDASAEELQQIANEIGEGVENGDDVPLDQQMVNGQVHGVAPKQTKIDEPEDPQLENAIGESGQKAGPEGMHLQTGEHVESQTIFDQLSEDYKEQDIQWVKSVAWRGPMEVPLSSIDFSNKDNWQASDDEDHVDHFVDKISNEGFSKPIILVNQPHNDNKMVILDGHHRALAYQKIGQPVLAYVGDVGMVTDEMKKMHDRQAGGKDASNQAASNQIASNQK